MENKDINRDIERTIEMTDSVSKLINAIGKEMDGHKMSENYMMLGTVLGEILLKIERAIPNNKQTKIEYSAPEIMAIAVAFADYIKNGDPDEYFKA